MYAPLYAWILFKTEWTSGNWYARKAPLFFNRSLSTSQIRRFSPLLFNLACLYSVFCIHGLQRAYYASLCIDSLCWRVMTPIWREILPSYERVAKNVYKENVFNFWLPLVYIMVRARLSGLPVLFDSSEALLIYDGPVHQQLGVSVAHGFFLDDSWFLRCVFDRMTEPLY